MEMELMRRIRNLWRLLTGHTRRRRLAIESAKFNRDCNDTIEKLEAIRERSTSRLERIRCVNAIYQIRMIQMRTNRGL